MLRMLVNRTRHLNHGKERIEPPCEGASKLEVKDRSGDPLTKWVIEFNDWTEFEKFVKTHGRVMLSPEARDIEHEGFEWALEIYDDYRE